LFAVIGFPHADDPSVSGTLRPNDDNHTLLKPADSDVTLLAVIIAIIFCGHMLPGKNIGAARKIQPAHLAVVRKWRRMMNGLSASVRVKLAATCVQYARRLL
jgi:hypothetical protein